MSVGWWTIGLWTLKNLGEEEEWMDGWMDKVARPVKGLHPGDGQRLLALLHTPLWEHFL